MSFGLSSTGFEIKRQQDIISSLEEEFKNAFGNINVGPDSVFGQFIGVSSKPLIDLWELAEMVYLSEYPNSAEGVQLDGVVALTGLLRLEATKTSVVGVLIGDQGTVVPEGTQVSVFETVDTFETIEEKTIDKNGVLKCTIGVQNVLDSQLYTVTIDGDDYSITSDSSATAEEIVGDLLIEINNGQSKVTAVNNGDETLTIAVDDNITTFSVDVDSNLQFQNIGTPVTFNCAVVGSISAPAGTLTVIETPVSGLDSVINLVDGVEGRDVETDQDLRNRRRTSLRVASAATVDSIRSRILQEVSGVTSISVYENNKGYYQDTIVVTVDTAEDLTDYSVFINGEEYTITSDASATVEEIAAALVDKINNTTTLDITAVDNVDGTFDIELGSDGVVLGFFAGVNLTQSNAKPPHSFECVVIGGSDQDIAEKIWQLKPAGIESFGNQTVVVQDSEGNNQSVKFTRPVPKYAWIYVDIELNDEENFPIDGSDQIKDKCIEKGENFGIGDDFILQKFFGPIYEIEGIENATITIAVTDDPMDTPSYVSTNLSIGETEILSFNLSRIIVAIST